jgi:hypothetical protein
MRLLIYIAPHHPLFRHLLSAMGAMGTTIESIPIGSVETLLEHLRRPSAGRCICILAPSGRKELRALVNQRHLMRDLRIALVLPKDDGMVADGHLLRPRFISQENTGFEDVKAVVVRMAQRLLDESTYPLQSACVGMGD